MLVAVFYYFGWDVASNLAEETANAKKVAGFGGIVGVLVIVALFLLAQVAIQMALTSDQIQKNAANLLPALGHVALSAPWSAIAVLAVMVSAVATLQTQLLQCTRLLFSMARDGVIGEPMGWLHPRFQTPWLAGVAVLPQLGLRVSVISIGTILIGIVPLVYYRRRYKSRFYTDPPESAGAKQTP
jgi:amino acid transporter